MLGSKGIPVSRDQSRKMDFASRETTSPRASVDDAKRKHARPSVPPPPREPPMYVLLLRRMLCCVMLRFGTVCGAARIGGLARQVGASLRPQQKAGEAGGKKKTAGASIDRSFKTSKPKIRLLRSSSFRCSWPPHSWKNETTTGPSTPNPINPAGLP